MPVAAAAGMNHSFLASHQPAPTTTAETISAVHIPVIAFDPGFVLELIERERGTALLGVPTMQIAMLEHPDVASRDLSSLRSSVSGGSLVPAEADNTETDLTNGCHSE